MNVAAILFVNDLGQFRARSRVNRKSLIFWKIVL